MPSEQTKPMPWWGWVTAAFAGAFLVNSVPHTVMGLTGQPFPTPFSGGPPNLSSAVVNVLWGLFNLAVGIWLYGLSSKWMEDRVVFAVFIVAGVGFAVMLAYAFSSISAPAV